MPIPKEQVGYWAQGKQLLHTLSQGSTTEMVGTDGGIESGSGVNHSHGSLDEVYDPNIPLSAGFFYCLIYSEYLSKRGTYGYERQTRSKNNMLEIHITEK